MVTWSGARPRPFAGSELLSSAKIDILFVLQELTIRGFGPPWRERRERTWQRASCFDLGAICWQKRGKGGKIYTFGVGEKVNFYWSKGSGGKQSFLYRLEKTLPWVLGQEIFGRKIMLQVSKRWFNALHSGTISFPLFLFFFKNL